MNPVVVQLTRLGSSFGIVGRRVYVVRLNVSAFGRHGDLRRDSPEKFQK
jgi:hypothetical protein